VLPTRIDPLRIRRVLGAGSWSVPDRLGPGGWILRSLKFDADNRPAGSVIVTQSPAPIPSPETAPIVDGRPSADLTEWIHASIAWTHRNPTYEELALLKTAVWGDKGEAYQVFATADRHVNIHEHALHLWGRADGARCLPDFGAAGSI